MWIKLDSWGRRLIGIFGSLICSKTLMEPIFKPCGKFRRSPEGPLSQIHSPRLHVGAPWIISDLLRSVQMLKRVRLLKAMGSYRTYPSLIKLQPGFLSLRWKTCLWEELQPWFLSLQWRTCPWAEHWWYMYMIISLMPKGRSFTANSETKAAILPKGRYSILNSGTYVEVLLGMNRCGSFPLLSSPHSL